MQVIILAAGMGRRLGEYTKDNTKCMVCVNGTPLIDRLLTQLSAFDIERVIIVIGYKGDNLKNFIGDNYKGLPIEYIENNVYDKTNNIYSLWLAKEELKKDDTLLIESDIIFEDSILKKIIENPYPSLAAVDKYEAWMDGTMVCIDDDNKILNFVSKKNFQYKDIDSYYKTVNIYKFSKNFSEKQYIPLLDAYITVLGKNEYYEQVLNVIVMLGQCELQAYRLNNDKWYEIDDAQDLDIAETIFADDKSKLQKMQHRCGGYWRFPKMLDFINTKNPYFPTNRMKDELRANLNAMLEKHPSENGMISLLLGKLFNVKKDYICAGNGIYEIGKYIFGESDDQSVGIVAYTARLEDEPFYLKGRKNIILYDTSIPESENHSINNIIEFFKDKNIYSILVHNPDYVTGKLTTKNDLITLLDWAGSKNIRIVIDESYLDFSDNAATNTLISDAMLEKYRNLTVIKELSESYGINGLRLGTVCCGNTNWLRTVKNELPLWNINSYSEYFLQILGKYEFDYTKSIQQILAEKMRFFKMLKSMKFISVIPSQTNFFLCKLSKSINSETFAELLLTRFNILVKGIKGSHDNCAFFRIPVGNKFENDTFLNALKYFDEHYKDIKE